MGSGQKNVYLVRLGAKTGSSNLKVQSALCLFLPDKEAQVRSSCPRL